MAVTYKKISETDYERTGDTQGLLIPGDTPYVKLILPATTTPASQADTFATFPAVPANLFIEQSNATTLRIKQKGLYHISAGILQQVADAVVTSCLMVNSVEARWQSSDVWHIIEKVPFILVELEAGATIRFKYRMNRAETISTYQTYGFIVAQLKQQMPYIIANKGALVSGGAFQFDEDGNCFTENYSLNETKVGTWIDGKPIYKKTVQGSISLMAGAAYVYSPVLVSGVDSIIKSEHQFDQGSSRTTGEVFSSWSGVIAGTARIRKDDITNDVVLAFTTTSNFGAQTVVYQATVWYTKTTD
jgi:hypothetical protein